MRYNRLTQLKIFLHILYVVLDFLIYKFVQKEGLNGGTSITLNTKFFGLCNIKQLNFRHSNTTSKKFTVTVNFIQIETNGSKIVGKLSEGRLNVSDHFQRLPKTTEDFRGESRKCFNHIPRTNSSFIT